MSVGRRPVVGGNVRLLDTARELSAITLAWAARKLCSRAEMSSRFTDGVLRVSVELDRVDKAPPRDKPLPAEDRLVPKLGDGILLVDPTRELPDVIPPDKRLVPPATGLLLIVGEGTRTLGLKPDRPAEALPREMLMPPLMDRRELPPTRDELSPRPRR